MHFLISFQTSLDLADSRIALTGASLPCLSITHVRIEAKSGNVIETFNCRRVNSLLPPRSFI
jgi:hypothetical protein